MRLTITIEEDKEDQTHVVEPGGSGAGAGEDTTEPAAASGGGPPEWLLAELGEAPYTQGVTSSETLDAGPAALGMNGMASTYS